MSTHAHPLPRLLQDQEVLAELLHTMSQPLTSLRCSLELSVEEVAGRQNAALCVALQEAERVIGMVQLMREYLDSELCAPPLHSVALAPVLSDIVEQLSSVAAESGVGLRLTGTSDASMHIAITRLRLALQYLITALLEPPPATREITLRLEDGPVESRLCGGISSDASLILRTRHDSAIVTLRRVKLAIAGRLLKSAGASLVFADVEQSAFILSVPRKTDVAASPELFS